MKDIKGKNSLKFSRLDRSRSRDNQKNASVHSSRASREISQLQSSTRPPNFHNPTHATTLSEVLYTNQEQPLKIYKTNYFTALKYANIVTFEEGTRHGFSANLQYLEGGFSKFDLKINFNLPYDHRTIITPGGDVFLIGGQNADGNGKTGISAKFYKLVEERLEELQPMSQSRAKFGVCYLDEMIFCFGGITSSSGSNPQKKYHSMNITKSCEVYDLNIGKW